jgi:peptidoglycan/LPS O-acetylase OafA/YrhL
VILVSVGALFVALDANATTQQWRTWIPCIALGAAIPWVHNMTLSPITHAAAIVAKYSYGIYLVHGPAFWYAFMYHKDLPRAVQWPLWLLLTAAISALAYHLIEAPCIRLGVRLASGRRAPVPTPTMSPAP